MSTSTEVVLIASKVVLPGGDFTFIGGEFVLTGTELLGGTVMKILSSNLLIKVCMLSLYMHAFSPGGPAW